MVLCLGYHKAGAEGGSGCFPGVAVFSLLCPRTRFERTWAPIREFTGRSTLRACYPRCVRSDLEITLRLDFMLAQAAGMAKPLPSLTPDDAATERARLIACLTRGELPVPAFRAQRQRLGSDVYHLIDDARKLSLECVIGGLYLERLDELELDLAILEAWGEPKLIRPLCARRYGRGDERVGALGSRAEPRASTLSLIEVAKDLLRTLPRKEPREATLPAVAPKGVPSVAAIMERFCPRHWTGRRGAGGAALVFVGRDRRAHRVSGGPALQLA